MTLLGQTRQDLPFTVCDQFKPTVLEGQRCYSLDLSKINNKKARYGLKSGLVLIMDPLEKEKKAEAETRDKITSLNFESIQFSGSSAKIYLNTLASFTNYRAGSYAMSALKKMSGTNSFLELPDAAKKCKTETFEECHVVRYNAEVQKQCGCLPWSLNSIIGKQVNNKFAFSLHLFHLQKVSFCLPSSFTCYTAVSTTDTYGCNVSCTGLYADVAFTEDQVLSDSVHQKLAEVLAKGKCSLF